MIKRPPPEIEPYSNPVDRFMQLPEPTRMWLERLREDDLADLMEAMKFYHDFKSFRRFTKWLIITVVAIFVATAQFGEAIQKLLGWIRGGRG